MYKPSFLKLAPASILAVSYAFSISPSFHTTRIPLPPPPAVALIITGYPISLANFLAAVTSSNKPSPPGTTGTPALIMVSLAVILSPMLLIISGVGPINLIPWSAHICANFAFSAKKPYPGCTASALVISQAAITCGIFK